MGSAAPHTGAGLQVVNDAQKYLAQANRRIAELTVQIAAQRVIVKQGLDTGQQSEIAESLLHALEKSLGLFEKHREALARLKAGRKEGCSAEWQRTCRAAR
jgi:hypothetical protein